MSIGCGSGGLAVLVPYKTSFPLCIQIIIIKIAVETDCQERKALLNTSFFHNSEVRSQLRASNALLSLIGDFLADDDDVLVGHCLPNAGDTPTASKSLRVEGKLAFMLAVLLMFGIFRCCDGRHFDPRDGRYAPPFS